MIQTILHLSDTHNQHRNLPGLPPADVIVHSGDCTFSGSERELADFLDWFQALPYKYKIFIAGNHDTCLSHADLSHLKENTFYLCHSSVEIEGLRFYGLPMLVDDVLQQREEERILSIPTDTDVLISHQPPYGILDFAQHRNWGSRALLERVREVQPKVHLFGHIHGVYGCKQVGDTLFANSSVVDMRYMLCEGAQVVEVR